jgi:hypothetical protein
MISPASLLANGDGGTDDDPMAWTSAFDAGASVARWTLAVVVETEIK